MNIAINWIGSPRRTDSSAPVAPPQRRFAHRLSAVISKVAVAITAANDTRVPF